MVFYATWYVMYDENTSNDTSAQRFRTKHSFFIFGVQETLYYLNVASKNRMPHFRRSKLGPYQWITSSKVNKTCQVFYFTCLFHIINYVGK
jgi:hypothetical protein